MVNIFGEAQSMFLTLVTSSRSYIFCGDGPNTILDTSGVEYIAKEPNADEEECAMGFLIGTVQLLDSLCVNTREECYLARSWT